jgi:hypothetical protein
MDLVVLREDELPLALRALRDVVASDGRVTPAERRFIEVVAELHASKADVDALASIEPKAVAAAIVEPHKRKRVVQLAMIASMVEGDVTAAGAAAVKALARALEVDDAGLKVLEEIVGGHRLQGAFQAGFIREDGFAFLMFVIIQFHLGVKITPVADAETGLFDVAKVLRAAQRGAACKVDLSDRWNPFDVVQLPLEEVRTRFGIPPL